MADNETQETAAQTAETTEASEQATDAVETQSPATDKGIDEAATDETETEPAEEKAPEVEEEISYHAVEKEGEVTAIWEMRGRRHIRTIDPRSSEGKKILSLFETAV